VEIMAEGGHTVDMKGFRALMKEQKEKARKARKETNYMGADATVYEDLDPTIKSEFVGYETLRCEADVIAMTTESEVVMALAAGEIGAVVTTLTPFYAASGGQCGDRGTINVVGGGEFLVTDTLKLSSDKIAHIGKVTRGSIKNGSHVSLAVDAGRRLDTCKNHSATHLLQKALRTVLGTHVEQAGSYVDGERLRFDFSHFAALTPEELADVERLVNEQIAENLPITTEEMPIDEARKAGAMALFGERYGAMVRVVRMGDFSIELCGGTHASNTGEIGAFKIVSETGIAAGTRRIEAITGRGVFVHFENMERMLNEAAKAAKTTPAKLGEKVESLVTELKRLQSENESLKSIAAKQALGDIEKQVTEVGGVKLLAAKVVGVDAVGLRELGDQQKEKMTNCMVVLISDDDGKVNMMATADEAAQMNGAHAGGLIKASAPLVGGGGGGRAGMAQAGGTNPKGIEEALKQAQKVLKGQLL
jgi:alanyl-tRNA synthetase